MKFISGVVFFFLLSFDAYSQEPSSIKNAQMIQNAQLESTIVILEDSIRAREFIKSLRLIVESRRVIDSVNVINFQNTKINTTLSFSALVYWNQIQKASVLAADEIRNSLNVRRISGLTFLKLDTGLLIFMGIMFGISILAGAIVYIIIRRLGLRCKKQADTDKNNFFGMLFLFLTRLARGAGTGIAVLCISLQFGNSAFGLFLMHTAFAVALFSTTAALIRVALSKEFPDYRLLSSEHERCGLYFANATRILELSFLSWLFYEISMLLYWNVTSLFVAGTFKILFTVLTVRLFFMMRNSLVKLIPDVKSRSRFTKSIFTMLTVIIAHFYIIVLVSLSIMTIASFSSDKGLYTYLLNSLIQTVIIVCVLLLFLYGFRYIVRGIQGHPEHLTIDSNYFRQMLITNKKVIEQGGYSLICITGVLFLVHTWGINVYRLVQSDIPLISSITHIFAIIIISFLLIQLLFLLIGGFQKEALKKMSISQYDESEIQKRIDTLGNIFRKITITAVVVVASIMIIEELGFDIKAMLAGVGIVGLALGFGAQNLVRDVISGLFVIFENRIRVGDVAIVNGTGGLVEQVNLRTIVMRGFDGTVHVFPNGAINSLSNMTHEFSYYVFDISVAYKENVDRVMEVLKKVGDTMLADDEFKRFILEPLEVFGVDKFGASDILIKARIKTLPIKQWVVGREMNKRIKFTFEKEGIEIPFPHQNISFDENGKPFSMKIDGLEHLISSIRNSSDNKLTDKLEERV